MTIQLANVDALHLAAILSIAPSDRLHVVHTRGNINAAFFVEQVHHDLTTGGGLHKLILGCERVTDDVPARFGEAQFGTSTFSE